jgi:hypothetical protein
LPEFEDRLSKALLKCQHEKSRRKTACLGVRSAFGLTLARIMTGGATRRWSSPGPGSQAPRRAGVQVPASSRPPSPGGGLSARATPPKQPRPSLANRRSGPTRQRSLRDFAARRCSWPQAKPLLKWVNQQSDIGDLAGNLEAVGTARVRRFLKGRLTNAARSCAGGIAGWRRLAIVSVAGGNADRTRCCRGNQAQFNFRSLPSGLGPV